jgi:hypothetical protein
MLGRFHPATHRHASGHALRLVWALSGLAGADWQIWSDSLDLPPEKIAELAHALLAAEAAQSPAADTRHTPGVA